MAVDARQSVSIRPALLLPNLMPLMALTSGTTTLCHDNESLTAPEQDQDLELGQAWTWKVLRAVLGLQLPCLHYTNCKAKLKLNV